MLSLFLALVVLAAIVGSFDTSNETVFWIVFVVKVTAFFTALIFFIPRITRTFLRKYSDAVMQYIFVMAIMFMSAAIAEAIGLEGILGAFISGLIMNRYIPHVSPLMNRIEFIGNAIFIPYFLIGVGMLVNVRILFQGGHIIWIVAAIVFFGTFGKALAAYLASGIFRFPLSAGNMMFGLTSAHAAGAIAMVMIGMRIETAPGQPLVNDETIKNTAALFREKGSASRKSAEKLLELLGKDLQDVDVAASLNDQEAIKSLVEHGFGISFISALAAEDRVREGRLLLFDTGLAEAKRTFYLIRRKNVQLSESAENFVKFIQK